jgi:chromosome segregation ATPase
MEHFGEDIETTAELPQLDIRVLSATLERVEHAESNAKPAAQNAPEWQVADHLAELQDQVASLQAELREGENRYSRLAARHETLLQKFEKYETSLASKQHELSQTQEQLAKLEQQSRQISTDTVDMKQLVADSIQQLRQREQFILKQANEIKRLRKLLS